MLKISPWIMLISLCLNSGNALAAIPVQHATTEKKNRYMEQGVFVGGHTQTRLALLGARHSVTGGQERLVFDIGDALKDEAVDRPGFFHIAIQKSPRRVIIDLESVEKSKVTAEQLARTLAKSPFFGKAAFFFDSRHQHLTIELSLKTRAQIEVFELVAIGRPGRIVLDARRP